MRINKVHIKNFKNLQDFDITLDQDKMETILLGPNAVGKSNFLEALVLIFKFLDLEKKPPFDYTIWYRVKEKELKVEYEDGRYSFYKIEKSSDLLFGDQPEIRIKDFFKHKDQYLPKYVFTYYSGISNKLKNHFDDHQKRFYDKAKETGITKNDVEDLRRLFYVQLIHSYFVLLAYFSFTEDEKSTIKFLKDVLSITDLESVLFVLHRPTWKGKGDKRFWGASGLVEEFLQQLWKYATAPIYDLKATLKIDFRRNSKRDLLYLFVSNKANLQSLATFYNSNTDFFKALESTYISDLIEEVRVKVKKVNVSGDITFRELSEGEQQLLTVLGLLRFTKDDDSLILLDEPDTHLNPLWKWKYREYLKDVVKRPESTQIIINTHDPLVVGSMVKEEVRIFKYDKELNKITAEQPDIDPKGLGVPGILTSELFGLPTILDKETQTDLNEKRFLQGKLLRQGLSVEEEERFVKLKNSLDDLGFYDQTNDIWYNRYLAEISKNELFKKVEFTDEEKVLLEQESKKVLEKILTDESNENK